MFAFARLNQLSKEETLACFGQYYREVQATPGETSHANIRAFMRSGWDGIVFPQGSPLAPRGAAAGSSGR